MYIHLKQYCSSCVTLIIYAIFRVFQVTENDATQISRLENRRRSLY